MSRIHDMGGRYGDGEIPEKDDAVVFHHNWHARALACTLAAGAHGAWNIDSSRHARERLTPRDYASFTYYEKWMAALANLLVERGLVSADELAGAAKAAPLSANALRAADVPAAMRTVTPYRRAEGPAPRFVIGDKVRTCAYNPNPVKGGHTRLPAYAMGRIGTVLLCHGNHVLPDSNAHGNGPAPEPLYTIAFTAQALWHQDAEYAADVVTLDLWQSYLEPA